MLTQEGIGKLEVTQRLLVVADTLSIAVNQTMLGVKLGAQIFAVGSPVPNDCQQYGGVSGKMLRQVLVAGRRQTATRLHQPGLVDVLNERCS